MPGEQRPSPRPAPFNPRPSPTATPRAPPAARPPGRPAGHAALCAPRAGRAPPPSRCPGLGRSGDGSAGRARGSAAPFGAHVPRGHGDVVEGEPGGGHPAEAPPLASGLPLLAGLGRAAVGAVLLAGRHGGRAAGGGGRDGKGSGRGPGRARRRRRLRQAPHVPRVGGSAPPAPPPPRAPRPRPSGARAPRGPGQPAPGAGARGRASPWVRFRDSHRKRVRLAGWGNLLSKRCPRPHVLWRRAPC